MPNAYFVPGETPPPSFNSTFSDQNQTATITVATARTANTGNSPMKIVQVRAYMAGRGASRTVSIRMTGSYAGQTSNFTVASASSAANTGFKSINTGFSSTPAGSAVTFFTNGSTYFGNDATGGSNSVAGTSGRTLWGEYSYVQVPATPSTPSISGDRATGNISVSWSGISDWGDSSSGLGYKVELLLNGSLYQTADVGTATSTTFFSMPSGYTYSARIYAYNELSSFSGSPMSSVSGTSSGYFLEAPIVNYTVSFNSDGGSPTPANQTVQSGNTITLPTAPTKTNYQFNGWVSSYNSVTYSANSTSHAILANTTFTASWTQLTWTVSFNGNGGSTPSAQTVNRGSSITLPNSTRSGFTLLGWYTASVGGSSVGNAGGSYTPSSNITLFAQWQELAPGFTDEIVSATVPININFNTVADNRVVATNAASYSLISAGGTFPTWLSIDNSGYLSGSTNAVGVYIFRVRATSSTGQSVDSNIITITVFHPGKRYNAATATNIDFTNGAYRRDSSGAFVPLTIMRRYNGTSWTDID